MVLLDYISVLFTAVLLYLVSEVICFCYVYNIF